MAHFLRNMIVGYNKHAYGYFFVGPVGQNLIEALGEYDNPWGIGPSDHGFTEFMKPYRLKFGTQEYDNKAKEIAFDLIREKPFFYLKTIFYRIPQLLFPGCTWLYNYSSETLTMIRETYDDLMNISISNRVLHILGLVKKNPIVIIDYIAHRIYVRFFFLLGYIGFFLMLLRRHYFAFTLLFFVGIVASYPAILSHIEDRYLVPYYSVFAFAIGYLVFMFCETLKSKFKFIY